MFFCTPLVHFWEENNNEAFLVSKKPKIITQREGKRKDKNAGAIPKSWTPTSLQLTNMVTYLISKFWMECGRISDKLYLTYFSTRLWFLFLFLWTELLPICQDNPVISATAIVRLWWRGEGWRHPQLTQATQLACTPNHLLKVYTEGWISLSFTLEFTTKLCAKEKWFSYKG